MRFVDFWACKDFILKSHSISCHAQSCIFSSQVLLHAPSVTQSVPQNLLQELLPPLAALVRLLLLTVALQVISVDSVEGRRGDGIEALPPEQPPPVVLLWEGAREVAALTSTNFHFKLVK